MADLDDGETFQVAGSGKSVYTLKNTAGVYSCTCPAWRNQKASGDRRTCKHLKAHRGEQAELDRISRPEPPPRPVPPVREFRPARAVPALREEAVAWLCQAILDPHADFRNEQWEIIQGLVHERQRILVVQRTGWGKSMVYFVATRMLRDQEAGLTLLISPLLALMRNQLEAAERIGLRAVTINSTNTKEWARTNEEIESGQVDLLLISPERLANEQFFNKVLLPLAPELGMLVVDEAHCISDWGHDFRPDYRRVLTLARRLAPDIPLLCTTATANQRVWQDLQEQLGDVVVHRGGLRRASLGLQTLRLPQPADRLAWLADHFSELPGSGIIYTLTRRDAELVAEWLQSRGHSAFAYHGGVPKDSREMLEQDLLRNRIKALVATTALGMGFDKPDLGFVVHYQVPQSVVHYYQQVGRAGRAIPKAWGILLAGAEDSKIISYFERTAFPAPALVEHLLKVLQDAPGGLTMRDLQAVTNTRYGEIEKALKLLSVEECSPVVHDGQLWRRTEFSFRLDTENIERILGERRREAEEMQTYVDCTTCLMEFLQRGLDDTTASSCGCCANCLGRPLISPEVSPATRTQADALLKRAEKVVEIRKRFEEDFPAYGWSVGPIPVALRTESGRALCQWGEGLGVVVQDGKAAGRFDERLVRDLARLIERWQPEPAPEWVTAVPSARTGDLVPELARQLAAELNLPYQRGLCQVRPTELQGVSKNSILQSRNLDGAFQVAETVPPGPVLLVDDVVDSRWTLTVAGALLREAGAAAVHPVALAFIGEGDS